MPDADEMPLVRMPAKSVMKGHRMGKRRAPPDDEFDNAVAFMNLWITSSDFSKLQNIYDAFESLTTPQADRPDYTKFEAYKNMMKAATRMK